MIHKAVNWECNVVYCTCGAKGLEPLTLLKQGNLSVAVSLATPLAETVTMVYFMVYDPILEINRIAKLLPILSCEYGQNSPGGG